MECPNCGSRFLRPSRPRNFQEKMRSWWFVMPVRCDHCKTRFVTDTLGLAYMGYARCPKCQRMDLNKWTGESYDPKGMTAIKVALGANRFRCEYCRLNFASFRKRKEIFSFHRWERIDADRRAAKDTAVGRETQPVTERRRKRRISPDRRRDQG